MEVKAKAKFIRMSPRKVRLVINVIRGMDVIEALNQLKFITKKSCLPVTKLLLSAIANAEHNNGLTRNNLYIKDIRADMGPMLKRWKPKAFGRAGAIRKRMAHISVILAERVATQGKQAVKAVSIGVSGKDVKTVDVDSKKAPAKSLLEKKDLERNGKILEGLHVKGFDDKGKKPLPFDVRSAGRHQNNQNVDKKKLGRNKQFINKIFKRNSE